MTDREALLCTILTHPGDDTPRLCFADFVEENGDPELAAFVRSPAASCQGDSSVGQSCPWVGAVKSVPLFCPACSMLQSMGVPDVFLGESYDDQPPKYEVRHGFLSEVRCSWADWLSYHERLYWSPGRPTVIEVPCPARCSRTPVSVAEYHAGVAPFMVLVGEGQDQRWEVCTACSGRGTISQSVWETCQPLEWVELTTRPNDSFRVAHLDVINHWHGPMGNLRFDRVKCPSGVGISDPRNEWTCDAWGSRLKFRMPEPRP